MKTLSVRGVAGTRVPVLSAPIHGVYLEQHTKVCSIMTEPEKSPASSDIFQHAPISQLIGLEVQPGEVGEAEVFLDVGTKMHNPMGAVHGGVIALLADAATGIAFGRTLEDQQSFATVEMKTTYIRPIREGRLRAVAKLVQRGLRIGFVECTIEDQRRRLIAKASCTCSVNSL